MSVLTTFDKIAGELLEYVIAAHHRPELDDGEIASRVGILLDDLAVARTDGDDE